MSIRYNTNLRTHMASGYHIRKVFVVLVPMQSIHHCMTIFNVISSETFLKCQEVQWKMLNTPERGILMDLETQRGKL